MRNAFRIFRRDMKRLLRTSCCRAGHDRRMYYPSLYAWFNIAANIDPYSNTSGIKVAVANNDKDATSNDLTINAGNEIIKNLKENESTRMELLRMKKMLLKESNPENITRQS